VTTEQDDTPGHGATSESADDGDDEFADDAQPAMADSAATATSTVPGRTRPVNGWR
jgi:hypothetical protein